MRYHILILPSWHSEHGTDGNFIREHARMTASLGHETGFLYVYPGSIPGRSDIQWTHFDGVVKGTMESWFPPRIPILMNTWLSLYSKLTGAYISKHGRPDVIHAHGYLAGFAARFLGKGYQIPYIITEHNTAIPAGKVAWYHAGLLRKSYRDASRLIAVSRFLRDAMSPWLGGARVDVVYNPVDFSRFRSKESSSHSRLQLVWVGFLEPRKDPALVLDALKHLNQSVKFELKMIGEGPMRQQLTKLAEEYGLPVQWLGECSPEEVARHLAASDILVSSSDLETFGMVPAEALSCGLPVITTQSGGPVEFINDQVGLCVPKANPEAMANAIESIARQMDNYDPESIREYAYARFSFEKVGEQLNRIYGEVIDN